MAKKTSKKIHPALAMFGQRLREARKLKAWTQDDLAKTLKISVAYVSLLERSGRNPPVTLVWNAAMVLDVTPTFLLMEIA
jgi:transcriptional regulator with XRE-family HTH domain